MRFFQKRRAQPEMALAPVQMANSRSRENPLGAGWYPSGWRGAAERQLYRSLRGSVPIIDAAIDKLVRLIGEFRVHCADPEAEQELEEFLRRVKVNGCQTGIQNFIGCYFDQLLFYGTTVGEIVLTGDGQDIGALYNVNLDDVEFRQEDSPLNLTVCRRLPDGELLPAAYPELVITAALQPAHGNSPGISILHGLPFVSGILMKVYHCLGVNWDRLGNLRFAVTYKPSADGTDRAYAKERAQQIAQEWSRAMQAGDGVSDFVAVGDVNIRVIGSDNQILDSEVPVRQMLEQIVAKLGVPPFLLGLSWSSTERMSSQQADILTSELECYRRLLNPAVERICRLWLALHGFEPSCTVCWDNITLQDDVDLAEARLKNAQAAQIEHALKKEEAA